MRTLRFLIFASLLAIILFFATSDQGKTDQDPAVSAGDKPPSSCSISITMRTCGEPGELVGVASVCG